MVRVAVHIAGQPLRLHHQPILETKNGLARSHRRAPVGLRVGADRFHIRQDHAIYHPRLNRDPAQPVAHRRNTPAILPHVLLGDEPHRHHRPSLLVMARPNTRWASKIPNE